MPTERIAKYLARTGLCSRREAEKLIMEGRIDIDGKTLETPAWKVDGSEDIRLDGERIAKAETTKLWLFHKPIGVITTSKDPQGRKTIYDLLPPGMPRMLTVGRLDMNSEGLLLMTNDGELSRYLELPSTGWRRRYRVRVYGRVSENMLEKLRQGVTVEGVKYQPMEVTLDSTKGSNSWLTVVLTEGKNREIRKVMEHIGVQVNRLMRVAYGPFQLGALKEGELKEVAGKVMREQLTKFFDLQK